MRITNDELFNYIDRLPEPNVMTPRDDRDLNTGKSRVVHQSMDEVFIERLNQAIEEHIEDTEFGVDELGKEIGMSRSQLHRKLQALTGKSSSRYIRSYKLDKAKNLLQKNVGTISEISYQLGFSSPAYFGQVYFEEFGHAPSEETKIASNGQFENESQGSVRKLAAIMFTDIVGYTAIMGRNEQKALDLLKQSREIQKPLIEANNGKWLKEMGDGVLAQFDSAFDSVLCALRIQRSTQMGFEGKLRIGIHLGDVTIDNEDVFGDGVNIASRLQGIADPGGIYVSQSIQRAISGRSEFKTMHLGEIQLKNVDYLVNTYCLLDDGLPVPDADKIQRFRASRVMESGAPLASVNDTLIKEVFDELVKVKPSVSKYLMVDEDEDEEPDIRELADQIVKNYPWVIGVELRRLFSGSLRVLNRSRLNQIYITLHRTIQFLSFILLIEIYELCCQEKVKFDESFKNDLKGRFLELNFEDFVWIIQKVTKEIKETERFIPEMNELEEEFYNLLEFKLPKRNAAGNYYIEKNEEDIAKDCVDYQEKLVYILKNISFIVNYKLVTIKEIKVLKNRHQDAMFKHWMDILNSSDSDFRSKEQTFDSYSDSNAVLLMKNLKRPDNFLNLSPLIIDTRSEVIDSREKFSLKKDIFICEGFANNNIRYSGTEVTEESDLSSLSNYQDLVEDFRNIIQMKMNGKEGSDD